MIPLSFKTLPSEQAQPNVYMPLWGKNIYMKHSHTNLDTDILRRMLYAHMLILTHTLEMTPSSHIIIHLKMYQETQELFTQARTC